MPPVKRNKTNYPGVFFITKKHGRKIFYVRYRRDDKLIEEKTPAQSAAQASQLRADKIRGKASNRTRKDRLKKWTMNKLAKECFDLYPDDNHHYNCMSFYNRWLRDLFGEKAPSEITLAEAESLKKTLLKTRKPETVKRVLWIMRRIADIGVKKGLCDGLSFRIENPKYDNKRTEYLTTEQVHSLIETLENVEDLNVRGIILTALYTGLRRSAIFRLRWDDLDFDRGFIYLRNPKGGKDGEVDVIPMNSAVREVLGNHPKNESPYVFPGKNGNQRTDIKKSWATIREQAGLPEGFWFHSLRHTFASLLASSGKVNLYMLQKLLTHRTPEMTQRYAHLFDSALREAAESAVDVINGTASAFPKVEDRFCQDREKRKKQKASQIANHN